MAYCRLYYHLVWATKNRESTITAEYESVIYNYLRTKALGLGGTVFAINGVADHVHVVTTIPARISVATFIGQIKGVASSRFNKEYKTDRPFYWQEKYGAFTFDQKRLPNVIAYVENQKQHHTANTTIPVLEWLDDEKPMLIQEENPLYHIETDEWRREMLALG